MAETYIPTTPITCCICGFIFAVPDGFEEEACEKHVMFFCPKGHSQHFDQKKEQIPGAWTESEKAPN